MSGVLEVMALHAADAERAEAGGADRIELVGSVSFDGLSPNRRWSDRFGGRRPCPSG